MTTPADRTVVSADGTSIAVREIDSVSGTASIADLAKPALVIVGSVFDDVGSPMLTTLATRLSERFRVVLFDRRGRGGSGDTLPWSREREVEDVAAVLESLGGGPVHVLGLCTGAGLVLQALGAGVPFDRAVVYEPPYRAAAEPDQDDLTFAVQLDEMLEAGRRSAALRAFLVRVLGVPVTHVTALRLRPAAWRRMLRVAPTLPRDWRMMTGLGIPERVLSAIGVPVLVAAGTDSADWLKLAARAVVEAVPDSEHTVLIDQGHVADPEVLASEVERFLLR